jgi:outer membrane protein assembly factor BamB
MHRFYSIAYKYVPVSPKAVQVDKPYMCTEGTNGTMSPPQPLSRRALLSAGGACFAGSFLLDSWLFDAVAADGSDAVWQQRWADASHRKFTSASPNPGALSKAWSASPDESGPLTVECIDSDNVYVREYDRIVAYRRDDGAKQWVYSADEGSLSLPSLVGDTILVQENARVHAIAVGDGSARWTGQFAPSQQPFSTIVAADGDAYLPGRRSYFEVHPGTGFQRRSFGTRTLGTLVAAAGDALFWWANGTLRSTDHAGDIQWSASLGRSYPPSGRSIAVTEEAVMVRNLSPETGPTVTALNRKDGTSLWSTSEGVDGVVAVTADPERVYVGTNFEVRALDSATGTTEWTVATDGAAPQPVATPGTTFVPTTTGIRPVDPATGDRNGAESLSGRSVQSLAVAAGSVYAVADGELVALEVGA